MAHCGYLLLRYDDHCAKLPEMVIKGERSLNPKPFHYDPTDAVRKTPALIMIALKDAPCLLDISRQHPDNLGNLLRKQTGSQTEGTSKLSPDFISVKSSSITSSVVTSNAVLVSKQASAAV